MKRFIKVMFVVGSAALLFATTAQAQVTSTSAAGASPPTAAVDIQLMGTLQSALVLTIAGQDATNVISGSANNTMPTRSTANFDFGTFNTQSTALTNGSIHRVTAATAGAFAVAALNATATISGSGGNATVTLTLGAAGGTSPIAAGNTRYADGAGAWATSADGTVLDAVPVGLCPVGGCISGTPVPHELAVFLPDTQTAGNFTQVVSYDATL
ncbi:MAG: hypothetical protein JXP73_19105 [Deltaproteobacteria bacterium]|nr:hypothetical protein [Deltaproteobacteria bacterium]